jgi:hypothetical protein
VTSWAPPHHHRCVECGREWRCRQKFVTPEEERDCRSVKNSLCSRCLKKLDPPANTPDLPKLYKERMRAPSTRKPRVPWIYIAMRASKNT